MIKVNWKNLVENLIIIIVVFCVGGTVGYIASTKSNETTIALLRPTIEEAIRKETTAITNQVTTQIKKIKGKKSEPVQVVITPNTKSVIENTKQKMNTVDSIPFIENEPKEKKSFFRRLFKKRKKDKQ